MDSQSVLSAPRSSNVARRRRWFAEVITAEFRIPASKFNHEMKTREAPTPRLQAPEKPHASKLKSLAHFLVLLRVFVEAQLLVLRPRRRRGLHEVFRALRKVHPGGIL